MSDYNEALEVEAEIRRRDERKEAHAKHTPAKSNYYCPRCAVQNVWWVYSIYFGWPLYECCESNCGFQFEVPEE